MRKGHPPGCPFLLSQIVSLKNLREGVLVHVIDGIEAKVVNLLDDSFDVPFGWVEVHRDVINDLLLDSLPTHTQNLPLSVLPCLNYINLSRYQCSNLPPYTPSPQNRPRREHGHRGLPLSLPFLSSPMRTNRLLNNAIIPPSSSLLTFPAIRPLPCHLTSEQVWSFLSHIHSERRQSSPSHCRSYPKCRIGGIGRLAANRLRSASGRLPLGHRRSCRFPLRRLRDAPIIQPRLRLPSTRRCSLARGRQSARGT